MLRLQEVWMRTLEKSIPDVAGIRQDLFLCSDHHGRPGAWVYFGDWTWEHRVDYRGILWNEVLFDFDFPRWDQNVFWVHRLGMLLDALRIPHYVFPTGGKGIHVSLFLAPESRPKDWDWKDVRVSVWDWICQKLGIQTDKSRVNWSDTSQGALIRAEGGARLRPSTIDTWNGPNVIAYKFWSYSVTYATPLCTDSWRVNYPFAFRQWNAPNEILKQEPKKERESNPTRLPELIRKLVDYMAEGKDLCDYGRYSVAAHLISRGYTVSELVGLYSHCPDFRESITRSRLEGVARRWQERKLIPPSVGTIQDKCHCIKA